MRKVFSSETIRNIADSLPVTEQIESSGLPPMEGRIVEFRLLYQGPLRSNGSVEDKFLIRR